MATTTSTNATASVPSITPPNGCVVPLGGKGVVDEAATSTIGSVSCVRGHGVGLLGTLGGTRTPSLLVRSQTLYPLSYEGRATAARAHRSIPVRRRRLYHESRQA